MARKAIVYNGKHAAQRGPVRLKEMLEKKGYSVSNVQSVNKVVLDQYKPDLVVMPGGDSGYAYLNDSPISKTDLQRYIDEGGHYLGTCAGSYSAAHYTKNYYEGWDLAPDWNCIANNKEVLMKIITTTGLETTVTHLNGPIFVANNNKGTVLAKYISDNVAFNQMPAIVGDVRGRGRVSLSGPHPELDPQRPEVLDLMLKFLFPSTAPANTVLLSDVVDGGLRTAEFIEVNNRGPNTVRVGNYTTSLATFNYLMTLAILLINQGAGGNLTLKDVTGSPIPYVVLGKGELLKADYIKACVNLKSFIDINQRMPNYITTPIGKLSPFNVSHMWSRALKFYKEQGRLPSKIYVKSAGYASNGGTPAPEVPAELQKYLVATDHCQVNDPYIVSLAKSLGTSAKIVNHVRDSVSYSYYYNTRRGAVNTLKEKIGNCVDQAHATIALLRAAKKPAIYWHVLGKFNDNVNYGHVVGKVYENSKWVPFDTINKANTLGNITNWKLVQDYGTYIELPF